MDTYTINTRQLLPRPWTKVATRYMEHKAYMERKSNRPITFNPRGDKGYVWIENVGNGLRVTKAHEVDGVRIEHTGWFVDQWQDETVCGLVVQLPARQGSGGGGSEMYYPAVSDAWNDNCALVDLSSCTADKADCARRADHMAGLHAEECREFYAKDAAEQRKEEIEAEIVKVRQDALATANEYRKAKRLVGSENVGEWANLCGVIRAKIASAREEIEQLRGEWKRLDENYWNAVSNW